MLQGCNVGGVESPSADRKAIQKQTEIRNIGRKYPNVIQTGERKTKTSGEL